MTPRRALAVLAVALACAACAACTGTSSGPPSTGAAATAAPTTAQPGATSSPLPLRAHDWPTYHRTNDRAGFASGVPAPGGLSPAWTSQLDGAVYGQPLVLGDLVIAATEGDTVYGIGLVDGKVRWQRSLGRPVALHDLPCGNIDPLGITGTPAYDARTGSVFVVAETTGARHDLVALDARTGAVRFRRTVDIAGRDRHAEQQRGALAVAHGRVYVPFGGLAGDCGNYVGYVISSAVSGAGPTRVYAVPTRREGGIWAPSGVAVGRDGDVWAAVGNGASLHQPYDGSDSVLRLTPDLNRRLDFFAPTSWGQQNADDLDLGTTGPLLLEGLGRVLISGKDGNVYLLDAGRLGGIGGQLGAVGNCRGFGGLAWDAGRRLAFVPCTGGLLQVTVSSTAVRAGWRAPAEVNGSPVVGAGAVWTLDPPGGRLHVLAESSGRELASAKVGVTSRFASPVLVGGRVLVPTLKGITTLTISP